jgi:S1-C subfamily serine protease
MFAVLGVLLTLLASPLVAYRISLAWYEGKLKAEAKVARQELGDINLADFGRVSRLVAKAVGPSVVSIQTSGQRHYADERQFYSGQQPHPGHELTGQGSGVVVDKEGYILTNWHVIAGASDINVHLNGGAPVRAALIGMDVDMDLALLQIGQNDLVPIAWGDSSQMEVGDPVWAIGSPFGLDNTVTFGIISGKGRRASGMDSA